MTIRWQSKRPTETRDQTHDWTPFLGTDTIVSKVDVATGLTLSSSTILAGNRSVKFVVSGGIDGTIGSVVQTITTASGNVESETFLLPIRAIEEPVSLADAKAYLRVTSGDEDAKIEAMIPRARRWVEDHTGLALVQREFVERLVPSFGAIRLNHGPLFTVDSVDYVDTSGVDQTYVPRFWAGVGTIFPAAGESWPTLGTDESFAITYTAGFAEGEADDRLLGAMFALIEGEFSEGYAYPDRSVEAAERCCAYLRQMVA